MLPSFAGDHEISGFNLSTLWSGAQFIMVLRAGQSGKWGNAEVELACPVIVVFNSQISLCIAWPSLQ
jgi:hypothetical protein